MSDFAGLASIDFGQVGTITPARTAYGKTYDFDFEAQEFVRDVDDKVVVIDRLGTLRQVLVKELSTRRYNDLIYTGEYGTDAWAVLDDDPAVGSSTEALLVHYVTETMLGNPLVRYVIDVVVDSPEPDQLHVVCDVVDIFGATISFDEVVASDLEPDE